VNRRDFCVAAAGADLLAIDAVRGFVLMRGVMPPAPHPSDTGPIPRNDAERRLGLHVVSESWAPGTPERYGAVADCIGNEPAQLAAATDSTVGIQAAIDYAIHGGGMHRVRLGGGGYKTTDTIHLGYGTVAYGAVVLEGEGYRYRGVQYMAGTAIFTTRTDRPAINVQGARGSVLRGVALVGQLGAHVTRNNLATMEPAPLLDDTLAQSWDAPELGGARLDARYAPYAGVTVDAYAGPRPTDAYPAVVYPLFLGTTPQYGKLYSSDVRIEDCYVGGFTVAVANQPGDADGNGDYTSLDRVYIERCKWGVSAGNTQSRNLSLKDVKMGQVYTCLTNRRHGRQAGKFGGSIIDLSVAGAIRVFDFGGFYAAPIHFVNFYGESLWRIGDIFSSNTNEGSLLFSAGEFHFDLQGTARGHPAEIIKGGYAPVDLQLQGCYFQDFHSVVVLDILGISIEGCYFRHHPPRAHAYERFAHNALAGGCVTRTLATPDRSRLKCTWYNLDTGVRTSVPEFTARWAQSSRSTCIPFFSERVRLGGAHGEDVHAPYAGASRHKSTFRSVALVEDVLTLVFEVLSEDEALQHGPNPGDVMIDERTSSTFFVRERHGTTVQAVLQNNFRRTVAGIVTLCPFSEREGMIHWRNARIYTPRQVLRSSLAPDGQTYRVERPRAAPADWLMREVREGDALLLDLNDAATAAAAARIVEVGVDRMRLASQLESVTERERMVFFVRTGPTSAIGQ
jgi:hypothetical protein